VNEEQNCTAIWKLSAPFSVLCCAVGASFSPCVRLATACEHPWAAPGRGGSLTQLLGRDAWFAHWKDKLLILFSAILSQRAKARLGGLG